LYIAVAIESATIGLTLLASTSGKVYAGRGGRKMPKGRMLSKKISYDEKIAQLSIPAALLYTWCIPHLDVKGRIYGDPHILKGVVVPYKEECTPEAIKGYIQEMINIDVIIYYGTERKYIQFRGFDKNQTVNPEREAPSEIPPPDKLQTHSRVTPAEINISKVNIKEQPEADKLLKEVYDNGLNIYQLINKVKKKMKWKKDQKFPAEVLIEVCKRYFKDRPSIKNAWGWFIIVIQSESAVYFARKSIEEGEKWKKAPVAQSIKDIIRGIK